MRNLILLATYVLCLFGEGYSLAPQVVVGGAAATATATAARAAAAARAAGVSSGSHSVLHAGGFLLRHLKPRCFLPCAAALALASTLTLSTAAHAYELSGSVRVAERSVVPSTDKRALYLTVRQDGGTWNDGVRNFKSPPVLSKRIAASDLGQGAPFTVTLDSTADATPEGIALGQDVWLSGKTPLLVTARLDSDGVAATRSEDDLVGQCKIERKDDMWGSIDIAVEGRGLAGKFITRQNK
jgi:hypothetical protein